MTDRLLRNGMGVRFLAPGPCKEMGYVHGVDQEGFSIRYNRDGVSIKYDWTDQGVFEVTSLPDLAPNSHEAIAQALTVERLDRDRVEELLKLYREGMAEVLGIVHDDPTTDERYLRGLRKAARMLRGDENV